MRNEIIIPNGMEAELTKDMLSLKGKEGKNSRKFALGKIKMEKENGKIVISCEKASKKEKRLANSAAAHIKNMIRGVQKKFEYKLKVCSSHFPVTVKTEGRTAVIKNFLGEKVDRKVELPENTEIKIEKDIITISSTDKELAGQAAANLETITKIRGRDRRVFQDGIFIISKAEAEI